MIRRVFAWVYFIIGSIAFILSVAVSNAFTLGLSLFLLLVAVYLEVSINKEGIKKIIRTINPLYEAIDLKPVPVIKKELIQPQPKIETYEPEFWFPIEEDLIKLQEVKNNGI